MTRGYYYKERIGDRELEVGFLTYDELMNYLSTFDISLEVKEQNANDSKTDNETSQEENRECS